MEAALGRQAGSAPKLSFCCRCRFPGDGDGDAGRDAACVTGALGSAGVNSGSRSLGCPWTQDCAWPGAALLGHPVGQVVAQLTAGPALLPVVVLAEGGRGPPLSVGLLGFRPLLAFLSCFAVISFTCLQFAPARRTGQWVSASSVLCSRCLFFSHSLLRMNLKMHVSAASRPDTEGPRRLGRQGPVLCIFHLAGHWGH